MPYLHLPALVLVFSASLAHARDGGEEGSCIAASPGQSWVDVKALDARTCMPQTVEMQLWNGTIKVDGVLLRGRARERVAYLGEVFEREPATAPLWDSANNRLRMVRFMGPTAGTVAITGGIVGVAVNPLAGLGLLAVGGAMMGATAGVMNGTPNLSSLAATYTAARKPSPGAATTGSAPSRSTEASTPDTVVSRPPPAAADDLVTRMYAQATTPPPIPVVLAASQAVQTRLAAGIPAERILAAWAQATAHVKGWEAMDPGPLLEFGLTTLAPAPSAPAPVSRAPVTSPAAAAPPPLPVPAATVPPPPDDGTWVAVDLVLRSGADRARVYLKTPKDPNLPGGGGALIPVPEGRSYVHPGLYAMGYKFDGVLQTAWTRALVEGEPVEIACNGLLGYCR
ncbi:MAG: hypothetical protein ABIO70_13870 [Pseudomonadota bacterium]